MAEQSKPRVIKRYANRKLYDMSESCYITHDEIAALVKQGVDVKIVDNRTKEDLTTLTLTQILFKEEKKQRKTLPLQTLRGILQSGGDFIQRHITQPVDRIRDEAEETMRKMRVPFVRKGDEVEGEEPETQEEGAQAEASEDDAAAGRPGPADAMRDWIDNTSNAFENLQRTLEDRWTLILNSMGLLDANRKRITELEQRVADLEARLAARDGAEAPAEESGAAKDDAA